MSTCRCARDVRVWRACVCVCCGVHAYVSSVSVRVGVCECVCVRAYGVCDFRECCVALCVLSLRVYVVWSINTARLCVMWCCVVLCVRVCCVRKTYVAGDPSLHTASGFRSVRDTLLKFPASCVCTRVNTTHNNKIAQCNIFIFLYFFFSFFSSFLLRSPSLFLTLLDIFLIDTPPEGPSPFHS